MLDPSLTGFDPKRTPAAHQNCYSIMPPQPQHRDLFDVIVPCAYRSWFHCLTRLVTAPPVAVRPPSTTNCPPVVLEARSEQRKSTMLAISSTVV